MKNLDFNALSSFKGGSDAPNSYLELLQSLGYPNVVIFTRPVGAVVASAASKPKTCC